MRINDKLMTVATGLVLAVGGAAASLFLGEHDAPLSTPSPVLVASVAPVAASTTDAPVATDLSFAPASVSSGAKEITLSAIEPSERTAHKDAGADLATYGIDTQAPKLVALADISEMEFTRNTFETVELPEIVSVSPELPFKLKDYVDLKETHAATCALDIRATPIFGARVNFKMSAPCHPNVEFTISHAGLTFKERLNEKGTFEMKIPAFEEYSQFDIALADGTTTTVAAYIAGLSALERVGIAWNGENDTFLHAFENGAKAGDQGHIWRLEKNSFEASRMNGSGYMITLGNPDLENAVLAQVYTLPTRLQKRAKIVDLQIETFRGDTACGTEIALKIAHHRVKTGASKSKISLTLPACSAEDTTLVLKNAIKDMKVARK